MARSVKGKPRLVQSVDRALRMLEILASEPQGLTLSQLSDRLGLLRQTTQGLLRTLQAHEMVNQADKGRPYLLGPHICQLARRWTDHRGRALLARDVVCVLSRRINECVLLAELRGTAVFGLIDARSDQPLTVSYECESFTHPHAMATGKLLMAFLPPDRQKALLAKLQLTKIAPRTITSRQRLRKELTDVYRQGYAVIIEESAAGLGSLAVPVRDAGGKVITALGVSVPLVRFAQKRRSILRRRLLAAAEQIERLWSAR